MAKILIVDDNRLILQALSERLETMGHDTEVASNGREAIEILKQERPDLIIMDIVMPEMTGVEAAQIIRDNPANRALPIVAFTSQSKKGQWGGLFDDYLIKPFGFDDLSSIIDKFIKK